MSTTEPSINSAAIFPAACLTFALTSCGIQEDSQTDGSAEPPFTIRNVTGNLYEARHGHP